MMTCVFIWPRAARAITPELTSAIPPDALAVVLVQPSPRAQHAEPATPDVVQWAALAVAGRSAPAAIAEVAGGLKSLRTFPWAVVLLDVRARSIGADSHRLAFLSGALIVHTRGDNAAITQEIQSVLERWTSADTARVDALTTNGVRSYRLTDQRLPAWAAVEWGAVGDDYVITVGAGTFRRVVAGMHASRQTAEPDDWSLLLPAAEVGRARVAWGLRSAALRAALGDVMAGRPEQVLHALGLARSDAVLWSLRRDRRAFITRMVRRTGDAVRVTPITQALPANDRWRNRLPEKATAYAYIPHPLARIVNDAVDAWLALQRPDERVRIAQAFERFQQNAGVNVQSDLLDQLGDSLLIHDYPRHPAGLPLADTILVPIDGDAGRARRALDALLQQCADWVNPDRGGDGGSGHFWEPRIERLEDGIWTVRVGLYGPAVTVADGWLVLSYAPAAVRENLKLLAAPPEGGTHP
ncbi:MAG TPA: hypothetical protein P5572_11530 [Phycisphaerae bacterium]|nr:hypothetical protein [Phycisphaerales bacterium]HRX85639.1 hypothetical protein [Phycisphaerae bacterium]